MSWLSSATGIHIGGKHHPLIDVKRLGTNIGEAAAGLTGQSWAIPLIEGASQKGLGTSSPGPLGYLAEGAGSLLGPGGIASHLPGSIGSLGSGIGSGITNAVGGLLGNGQGGLDWGKALGLAAAASQVGAAQEAGRKADQFASEGWDLAKGNWDANNPLRKAGRERLLNPGTPDLSALDSIRAQIPGGLPAGAQTLSGASSVLGGSGSSPAPTSGSQMALPRPQGLSGQGPIAPTQPKPGLGGFQPVVRY